VAVDDVVDPEVAPGRVRCVGELKVSAAAHHHDRIGVLDESAHNGTAGRGSPPVPLEGLWAGGAGSLIAERPQR
jgi:hypothetical protein